MNVYVCIGCGSTQQRADGACWTCGSYNNSAVGGGSAGGGDSRAIFPSPKPEIKFDPVSKPKHYNSHPSGIQPIVFTRHMGFNLGNALKYVFRADLKNGIEDLRKAIWYIEDEIAKREGKERIT